MAEEALKLLTMFGSLTPSQPNSTPVEGVDPLAGKGPHLAAPPPDHQDRNVSGTPPKLVCGSHNPKSGQKQFYRCKGIDISCDVYVGGSPETTIAGGPTGRTTIVKVVEVSLNIS
ncbi:hypothetical protein Scep_004330 [Stephania cephalantha]|uniref:Uncharacterized protein n=1 Tax=Stephania cephalantha TaxID=152367 RepID=A0AAP0KSF2_9MAGN